MLECIMHHVFSYSDSCLYWYLAYICEDIFDLRIYVTVTSPYPWDRGVTAPILYRVYLVIWSKPYSGSSRIHNEHHALQGHAVFGDPHPPIKCHLDNHLCFSTNCTCSIRKIKLRCQIGDLRPEAICYVIDPDTLFNLLLGWPWIHRNYIVPSSLHQVTKYIDKDGKVRTLITERHPFKESKIISLISSSIRILLRLMRIHT